MENAAVGTFLSRTTRWQGRKSTQRQALSRTSGTFCLYYAFPLESSTLAEGLANSWQSGPRMPSASHWLAWPPSGRPVYLVLWARGQPAAWLHAPDLPPANRATTAPSPAKICQEPPSQRQGLVFARNVLAALIAPSPSPSPPGHTLPIPQKCPAASCGTWKQVAMDICPFR